MQVTLLIDGPLASLDPPATPTPAEAALVPSAKSMEFSPANAVDVLRAHFEYLAFLFQKLPPLSGLGASGFVYRDHLQVQPPFSCPVISQVCSQVPAPCAAASPAPSL